MFTNGYLKHKEGLQNTYDKGGGINDDIVESLQA